LRQFQLAPCPEGQRDAPLGRVWRREVCGELRAVATGVVRLGREGRPTKARTATAFARAKSFANRAIFRVLGPELRRKFTRITTFPSANGHGSITIRALLGRIDGMAVGRLAPTSYRGNYCDPDHSVPSVTGVTHGRDRVMPLPERRNRRSSLQAKLSSFRARRIKAISEQNILIF
jgi:hypothetical protein